MKRYFLLVLLLCVQLFGLTISTDTTLDEDVTYDENVTVSGCALDLNGHTLTVNGSFKTEGDNGVLVMQKSDDKLVVNGDITFAGSSTVGDLTKGTIEVTGNFYQVGTGNNNDWGKHSSNNKYSFYASDDNKVVFKGTQKQIVNFDSHGGYSQFANIDIENASADGVVLST